MDIDKLKLSGRDKLLLDEVFQRKHLVCLHVLDQDLTNALVRIILELSNEISRLEKKP